MQAVQKRWLETFMSHLFPESEISGRKNDHFYGCTKHYAPTIAVVEGGSTLAEQFELELVQDIVGPTPIDGGQHRCTGMPCLFGLPPPP